MDPEKIHQLLELICEIVRTPRIRWEKKRDAILETTNETTRAYLIEFATWFEDYEDVDDD